MQNIFAEQTPWHFLWLKRVSRGIAGTIFDVEGLLED